MKRIEWVPEMDEASRRTVTIEAILLRDHECALELKELWTHAWIVTAFAYGLVFGDIAGDIGAWAAHPEREGFSRVGVSAPWLAFLVLQLSLWNYRRRSRAVLKKYGREVAGK